jgi:hypothetical protein
MRRLVDAMHLLLCFRRLGVEDRCTCVRRLEEAVACTMARSRLSLVRWLGGGCRLYDGSEEAVACTMARRRLVDYDGCVRTSAFIGQQLLINSCSNSTPS